MEIVTVRDRARRVFRGEAIQNLFWESRDPPLADRRPFAADLRLLADYLQEESRRLEVSALEEDKARLEAQVHSLRRDLERRKRH